MMMRQLALASAVVGAAVVLGVVAVAAWSMTGRGGQAALTRHCAGFRYGLDGKQPGPTGITATNVSCWFARATALLGAAPGWHCRLTVGVLFVCPHGRQKVTFYGE